tara:strand:+ start:151 stop:573 length:423 start_codon:yes stop_codon:yes gene_type:complete
MNNQTKREKIKKNLSERVKKILKNHGDQYNALYAAVEALEQNRPNLAKSLIQTITGTCCAGATPEIHVELRNKIFSDLLLIKKEKLMENRYNELQKKDAQLVDELINSIASHKGLNLTSQLEKLNDDFADYVWREHVGKN